MSLWAFWLTALIFFVLGTFYGYRNGQRSVLMMEDRCPHGKTAYEPCDICD